MSNPYNDNNDFVDSCAFSRTKTINDRLYNRLSPSQPLQPYLSVAPVQTKYTVLPMINHRVQPTEQIVQRPTYDIKSTFNPGTRGAPWSGFASEINTESVLRNQVYALQKCGQAVYVPKSTSDLYNIKHHPNGGAQMQQQPFPGLFSDYTPVGPGHGSVLDKGPALFNNSTRILLKEEDC